MRHARCISTSCASRRSSCPASTTPASSMRSRARVAMVYVPGALLLTLYVLVAKSILRTSLSLVEMSWLLDRFWLAYMTAAWLLGALALALKSRDVDDPIVRRQLTYLRNGAILGVVPFT